MLIVSLEYGFLVEIEAHIVFFVCVAMCVGGYLFGTYTSF